MYSSINRRPSFLTQTPNRIITNKQSFAANQSAKTHNTSTPSRSTQSNYPQANKKDSNKLTSSTKDSVSQLLRKDGLNLAQKNTLNNITALTALLSTNKFSNLLKNTSNLGLNENPYTSSFFASVEEPNPNLFTKDEIVDFVTDAGICNPGEEEEFVDSLIEICSPEETNFVDEELTELPASAKNFLHESNVEEEPSVLRIIAKLLAGMVNNPNLAISGDFKKRVFDILKEDKNKVQVEADEFDYAEVSEVT